MKWVVGIDEVGRGPVAGPVTVCATALPLAVYKKLLSKNSWAELNDSKKMTPRAREKWYLEAKLLSKKGVIKYAISSRSAASIDKKGIAACIRACIADNLKKLQLDQNDCVILLDGGLKAPMEYRNQQTIIRGDGSEKIISLASVIAKVTRDHYMVARHRAHPHYHWDKNKGYGTKVHLAAIKKWGLTPFHRKTFLTRLA